jgi:RNA polymerase sigma factor (sigma-70 family)
MSGGTSTELQALLDRLRQGDTGARQQLLERAYERLRRLAGALFRRSFPGLQGRHELDSVLNRTWLRLLQALETSQPPTVADFFRLAAHKVRQVLLDLAEQEQRRCRHEVQATADADSSVEPNDPADTTFEPVKLALWTEFHRGLEACTAEERAVFELHYYLDLPQAEIASLLNLHPRKVSRLWIAATDKLVDGLPGPGDPP